MSRPKIDYRSTSKEAYDKFCEKNPNIDLSYIDYKRIIYTYNANVVNHMLETGDQLKLPYGLGPLVINKYKPKKFCIDSDGKERINLPIDWIETKKAGKYIYLLNSHTEGYKFYWMWNHWKSKLKLAHIWKVVMARNNSRLLNDYLKKPNSKYKDIYKEYPRTK